MEGNPLAIEAPYDVMDFIQKVEPYGSNYGVDEMLDLMREIQLSEGYYWQGVAFPSQELILIPARGTVSGSVQIPVGSYVISLQYYASLPAGVKFKIFDKGSKASIFYGDYALDRTVASNMQIQYGLGTTTPPSDPGMNLDSAFGQAFLTSPFVITDPGVLGFEIVNLATDTNLVQFMLSCAIPVKLGTIGKVQVSKGTGRN